MFHLRLANSRISAREAYQPMMYDSGKGVGDARVGLRGQGKRCANLRIGFLLDNGMYDADWEDVRARIVDRRDARQISTLSDGETRYGRLRLLRGSKRWLLDLRETQFGGLIAVSLAVANKERVLPDPDNESIFRTCKHTVISYEMNVR